MNSATKIELPKLDDNKIQQIFADAKQRVEDHYLEFTGTVLPHEAWALFQAGHAVIVDVRTNEERKFVGYVEDTIHIPWATGTALNRNPRFAKELESKVGKDKTILLLCRSGKRSAAAANVAFNAGFENIYNIEQGFEGDLDEDNHRGSFNGWRFHHLPWRQE
ncbi:rhodanese-like domain-containing protein [Acinetobacter sp. WCHAc010052]|uniref:rhodanese-like domain-containing protein n=1 Tax=Acinetobacter sp. WCHAc010052 TaxID=2004647 RepID=UPI000B3CBE76|nr:rhodanese-like domain-containing protein [Acinetobacter sp. WCHAc010052]AXY60419.1 rhodanese-like domain-containing protein [Acinetobacter sp. WCHAc010052]